MREWKEKFLPAIAMVFIQWVASVMALLTRAALVKGMSPRVFIFYRQTIATLVISPVAFFTSRKSRSPSMGVRSFFLIFFAAFIGVVFNQTVFFEGLYSASSSVATAMGNLNPAVTFVIAAIMRLEKVNLKRLSSIAKILGTAVSVGGAVLMALVKGPKLINSELSSSNSLLFQSFGDDTWLLGCLCIFASTLCWSSWLILQVPIAESYPNPISVSAWMCFLAMLQGGGSALFFERDLQAWNFSSTLEITCCFFSGIFGSGIQFFVQSWCISRRGPVFSAMFSPLCTVITTILACIFLHEQIYLGSLVGAIAAIIGLYVVLWGKSEENISSQKITAETYQGKTQCDADLEQPLMRDQIS